MKKVLVVGIIVLFLGVGFQPALANEVSNNIASDVEEDCFECQPVNRVELLKVKLLLIRLEAFTNVVLSRFGHIPEVEEKCQEISDEIMALQERTNELKFEPPFQDNSMICTILISIFAIIFIIVENFPSFKDFPILETIFIIPLLAMASLLVVLGGLLLYYDCWEEPHL